MKLLRISWSGFLSFQVEKYPRVLTVGKPLRDAGRLGDVCTHILADADYGRVIYLSFGGQNEQ